MGKGKYCEGITTGARMVEAIEGKVDAWMVSAVRDWFIFLIDVIHFFWFLLGTFFTKFHAETNQKQD